MKSIPRVLVLLAIAIAPLITVFYALDVVNGVPLGDEWRWFRDLLLPYADGEIGFWSYISGEYSFLGHTHFLTLVAFLLSYQFFSLDLVYLAYFGLFFYVLGGLFLLRFAYHSSPGRPKQAALGAVIAGMAYFSITTDFPWLLVSFEYFYYFFALAFLVLVDAFLRGRAEFSWLCVATFFSALFLDSFGAVAVLTTIVALAVSSLIERRGWYQPIILLGIYILAWVFLEVAIDGGVGTSSGSRLHTFRMLLNAPLDIFMSLLASFSQPLVDKAILQHYLPSHYKVAQVIIGAAGLGLFVIALVGYARSFHGAKSRLPFLIAGYAVVAWALILLTRYSDFGVGVTDAQRFTRFFVLYYVAAAFAFLGWRSASRVFLLFAVFLASSYAISAGYQYRYADSVKEYFHGADVALRESVLQEGVLDRYVGPCSDRRCDKTIYALREKDVSFVQVHHQ